MKQLSKKKKRKKIVDNEKSAYKKKGPLKIYDRDHHRYLAGNVDLHST